MLHADDRKCKLTLHHLGPIITQIRKAYITACLSNEITVSNEIIGPVRPVLVFILIKTEDKSNCQPSKQMDGFNILDENTTTGFFWAILSSMCTVPGTVRVELW